MKSVFIFLAALFIVAAQSVEIPDELKQWKCDSSEVRLSKKPIPCLGDFPTDFDIPAIELNLEDLQKIFDGAVSSGGHVIGPMNSPRQLQALGPDDFTLTCQVRVLLDGGKRISYLSTSKTLLTNARYFIAFAGLHFKHYLTPINDVDSTVRVKAPKSPKIGLEDLYTEVAYNKLSKKYALKACVQKRDPAKGSSEMSCSHTPFELSDDKVETMLVNSLSAPALQVERTIKMSCRLSI